MPFKNLKVERIESGRRPMFNLCASSSKRGFIKVGDKKWFLPYRYVEDGNKIYSFETRPDDTWIICHPRTGSTMTQELVWLVANDMNFDEAHRRPLQERFPHIEGGLLVDDDAFLVNREKIEKYSIEYTRDLPSPRFIKSHMPFDLLPTVVSSDCKIIYVARNPKDVVVSYYNFLKDFKYAGYEGTLEQFCDMFIDGYTYWSPYLEHVKEAWAMKNRANLLFIFFEDLKKDLFRTIKKIAVFFDKTYSDEQIAKLMEHLNIDNFRKNSMVNLAESDPVIDPKQFIRQGKTGSWKEIFTPKIEEKFNKWLADNMKDTDLTFPD